MVRHYLSSFLEVLKKTSIRIASLRAKIRTQDSPNKKQKCDVQSSENRIVKCYLSFSVHMYLRLLSFLLADK